MGGLRLENSAQFAPLRFPGAFPLGAVPLLTAVLSPLHLCVESGQTQTERVRFDG